MTVKEEVTMSLKQLLEQSDVTLQQIQDHLGALSDEARVQQATDLKGKQLSILWRLSDKTEAIALDEVVPEGHAPLAPIPFEGQNSLPLFRRFQKVFYRTPDGRIAGYNNSPVGWLVGPGYYILKKDDTGIYVDYTDLPNEKPSEWPPIKRNDAGITTLVYGNMKDYLRRVYGKVFIGKAYKKGKETENYFTLAR